MCQTQTTVLVVNYLKVFEKPVNKDMTSYFVIEEINYEVHYAYASFDGSNP